MTTGQKEAHKCNLVTMHHLYKKVLDPTAFACRELAGAVNVGTLFLGTSLFACIEALLLP